MKFFTKRINSFTCTLIIGIAALAMFFAAVHYYMACAMPSSFVSTMNEICDITEFDSSHRSLLMSVLPTDESERVDQVQAVYALLLKLHRNDDDILKKLLDFDDLIIIRNYSWISRYVWIDFDDTKGCIYFSTDKPSWESELGRQADVLRSKLIMDRTIMQN